MKNNIQIYPAIARADEKLSIVENIKYLVHNMDENGNLTDFVTDEPSSQLLNVNKMSENVFFITVTSMMGVVKVSNSFKSKGHVRRC